MGLLGVGQENGGQDRGTVRHFAGKQKLACHLAPGADVMLMHNHPCRAMRLPVEEQQREEEKEEEEEWHGVDTFATLHRCPVPAYPHSIYAQ